MVCICICVFALVYFYQCISTGVFVLLHLCVCTVCKTRRAVLHLGRSEKEVNNECNTCQGFETTATPSE